MKECAHADQSYQAVLVASAICAFVASSFYLFEFWPSGHAGNIYVALHFALTIAMLVLWVSPQIDMRRLLILGVVLRIALVPVAPISSNDLERYLWDGAVALSGLDPYTVAPDNPLAKDLREVWATPPEHAKYPTLYPPAALSIFALSAFGGASLGIWVWKMIATSAGILSLFVMRRVALHYGQERHFALIVLSPLLILETGIGAHLDALLVLGLSLVLYFHAKEQWGWLGVALGWSACIKFFPLALLAPLFFAVPFRGFVKLLGTCLAVVAFFYAGAVILGYAPIGILPTFFEKWRFTSPIYQLLEYVWMPARVFVPLAALAIIGIAVSCFAARRSVIAGFAVILSVPLLLSPVVFPWYLMILVPIVALWPKTTLLAWTSVVPISYVVLNQWIAQRLWEPAHWPVVVIGCVLVICLAWDLATMKKSAHRQSNATDMKTNGATL